MFKYALVLAGGKGTRLRPLTISVPKPLLPVGDKPIIEDIILKLKRHGINHIFVSVNYKKEMIMNYLKDGENLGVKIEYLEEEEETGTAGSLTLLPIEEDIILINGDVLNDVDFTRVYDELRRFDMIIVAAEYECKIDFGVLKFADDGTLKSWHEKPKYTFYVNSGIYGLSKKVIKFVKERIPKCRKIDMPELWDKLVEKGFKLGVYIHKGVWKDIGRLDDYMKLIQ